MNIILADSQEIADGLLTLSDRRAEHMVKVLRSVEGDEVRVGLVNGPMGTGKVLELRRKYPFQAVLAVTFGLPQLPRPGIDLILALPRPIMLRRILSQVTALGVGEIHLIQANRVEKSFWDATILNEEEYREHLLLGLEQAVDTRVPKLFLHRRFKPFIEDYLPAQTTFPSARLLAHPVGEQPMAEILSRRPERVLMAIGPEGGWVDYEVEQFLQQGFACCSFGPRILKVDTAVVAMHARISAILEKV